MKGKVFAVLCAAALLACGLGGCYYQEAKERAETGGAMVTVNEDAEKISQEDFNKLKIGMSQQEALERVGKKPSVITKYQDGAQGVYDYIEWPSDGGIYYAAFEKGKLSNKFFADEEQIKREGGTITKA